MENPTLLFLEPAAAKLENLASEQQQLRRAEEAHSRKQDTKREMQRLLLHRKNTLHGDRMFHCFSKGPLPRLSPSFGKFKHRRTIFGIPREDLLIFPEQMRLVSMVKEWNDIVIAEEATYQNPINLDSNDSEAIDLEKELSAFVNDITEAPFDADASLLMRESLRENHHVQQFGRLFWSCLKNDSEQVSMNDLVKFSLILQKLIFDNMKQYSYEIILQNLESEFEVQVVTYNEFYRAFFEFVDSWMKDTKLETALDFLIEMKERIIKIEAKNHSEQRSKQTGESFILRDVKDIVPRILFKDIRSSNTKK